VGLLRLLERDEAIAFVIGHEIAHQIDLGRGKRRSRIPEDEARADYVGAYLAERAGYRLDPEDFGLVQAAHAQPRRLTIEPTSHPSTPARQVLFRDALVEIATKRAQGEALLPQWRAP